MLSFWQNHFFCRVLKAVTASLCWKQYYNRLYRCSNGVRPQLEITWLQTWHIKILWPNCLQECKLCYCHFLAGFWSDNLRRPAQFNISQREYFQKMAAQTQYKKHVKTTITKDEPHCHSSRKKIFNTDINLLAYRCSNELNGLSFRSIWDGWQFGMSVVRFFRHMDYDEWYFRLGKVFFWADHSRSFQLEI